MAAYIIVQIEIKEPVEYAEYRSLVPATLVPYGGRFLVRGGAMESLEGGWAPERVVVVEFPTLEAAKAWHGSAEYARARAIRWRTAESKMLVVQGVE